MSGENKVENEVRVVGRVLDFMREFCVSPHTTLTLHLELTDLGTHPSQALRARCKNSCSQRAARARVPPAINAVTRYKGIKEASESYSPQTRAIAFTRKREPLGEHFLYVHGFLRPFRTLVAAAASTSTLVCYVGELQ